MYQYSHAPGAVSSPTVVRHTLKQILSTEVDNGGGCPEGHSTYPKRIAMKKIASIRMKGMSHRLIDSVIEGAVLIILCIEPSGFEKSLRSVKGNDQNNVMRHTVVHANDNLDKALTAH